MKKEIVYTDKYALILSDEIPTKVYYDTYIHQLKHTGGAEYGESSIAKTVVGHLPLTDDSPILEGVPLLPSLPQGEDTPVLEELSPNHDYPEKVVISRDSFIRGFNKAKKKYKYTEEDMLKAMKFAKTFSSSITDIHYIQSLHQPSRPTHFECEMVDFEVDMGLGEECIEYSQYPKTITNSQGQVELVGKYLNL